MIQQFHFGHIPEKGNEITMLKRYLHPYVHCSTIPNSHTMEITLVPINGLMDKENKIYVWIDRNINIIQAQKGKRSCHCYNMDKPGEDYAK